MKPEEKPLPVRAPEGQGAWDTHNIKAAVGMALAVVLAKLAMMVRYPQFYFRMVLGNRNMYSCVESLHAIRAKRRSLAELGFHRVVGLCGAFSVTCRGSRSGSRGKPGSSRRCRPI